MCVCVFKTVISFQEWKYNLSIASVDSLYFFQHNYLKMQRPVIVKKQPHNTLGA